MVKTQAQEFFGKSNILTSRPDGMPFDDYRKLLFIQNKIIKKLFTHKPYRNVARMMPLKFGYNQHLI